MKKHTKETKSSTPKCKLLKKKNLIYLFVWFVIILALIFGFMNTKKNDCSVAIKDYLKAADMVWNWAEVKSGDNIVVDYVWRFDDKEVFDTSVEVVAKACDKYTEWRNYAEWLPFTVGAGQMIAWFDKAVVWMKVGQTKTIVLAPKDAYGEKDEAQIATIEKSKIPNADQYQEGMKVQTPYWQVLTVIKVEKDTITFDGNSEMAGKTLTFDITIKKIWK